MKVRFRSTSQLYPDCLSYASQKFGIELLIVGLPSFRRSLQKPCGCGFPRQNKARLNSVRNESGDSLTWVPGVKESENWQQHDQNLPPCHEYVYICIQVTPNNSYCFSAPGRKIHVKYPVFFHHPWLHPYKWLCNFLPFFTWSPVPLAKVK